MDIVTFVVMLGIVSLVSIATWEYLKNPHLLVIGITCAVAGLLYLGLSTVTVTLSIWTLVMAVAVFMSVIVYGMKKNQLAITTGITCAFILVISLISL